MQPEVSVRRETKPRALDPARRQLIAQDLNNAITAAYSARQPMEENWRMYNEVYELVTQQINQPFVNSSNVPLPVAVAKLDTLFWQVAAKVFTPDLFVVTGSTADADATAWEIQEWYNKEFRRKRDRDRTRMETSLDLLHYGLLEGIGVLAVSWRHEEQVQVYTVRAPISDDDGNFEMDEDGNFEHEEYEVYQTLVISEAQWRAVQAKDFYLIPNESPTPEMATGVAECFWLYESDMRAMCEPNESGYADMDEEWVELALAYSPSGQTDVAADRQGSWDKSSGGQIQIGQGQGPMVSPEFKNRGPIKVWKYTGDQFDMNDDGVIERNNIFWWAEMSNYLLGWTPSRTVARERGYFGFAPLPRKNSFIGFSFIERMAPINAELNMIHNTRNNRALLAMKPPMLGNLNMETHEKKYKWELGKVWWVDDVNNAFKPLEIADVPISGYQEESLLNAYADQLAGISAPQAGGQTSGKKSATEIKASIQGSGSRSDGIALLLRYTLRDAIQYTHELNLQNLPEEPPKGRYQPDKETLNQDYLIDVAGTGDPIDMQTYSQEFMFFYDRMSQDPDIQKDAEKRYALKRSFANLLHISNVDSILGTADEAKQRKAQEAQQAQQAMALQLEMAKAKIAHEYKGSKEDGGAAAKGQDPGAGGQGGQGGPPQNGQPQPQPAMNGAPAGPPAG